MEEKELISIIITAYNMDEFITECIESVRKQTYKNLEIVIVDDGSTDSTSQICDHFSQLDERIKVVHQNNFGLPRARKSGIMNANGKYIGFVDADDYVHPQMFERLYQYIIETDADFVHSCYYEDTNGVLKKNATLCPDILDLTSDTKRKKIILEYFLFPNEYRFVAYGLCMKFFKKEFISKCYANVSDALWGGYGEDVLVLLWAFVYARKIFLSNEAYYYQRIRQYSMSHFDRKESVIKELYLCREIMNICEKNNQFIKKEDMDNFIEGRIKWATQQRFPYIMFPVFYYNRNKLQELRGKKIVLYGAGEVGKNYLIQFSNEEIDVIAVADRRGCRCRIPFSNAIILPEEIMDFDFDKVVIAIRDEEVACDVKNKLISQGILEDHIIWDEPEEV